MTRKVVAALRPYLARQRALMAGGTVALLFEVGLRLLEPWPLALIIDRVSGAEGTGGFGWFGELPVEVAIALAAGALVIVSSLRALASYLATVSFALSGIRVVTELRGELFGHLQRLSLSWHDRARSGDLLARLTADVGRLQDVSVTAALPLVGNVLAMIGMVAVMIVLKWPLGLIALSAVPVFVLMGRGRGRRIKSISRRQRKLEGALASSASEVFGAMAVVQANTLEPAMQRAFAAKNRSSLRDGVKAKRLAAGLERRTDVVIALATGAVLLVGSRSVLAGTMTPGELVVFVLYLRSAYRPLRDLAKYTGRLARALASAERVVEILDSEPTIVDAPRAVEADRLDGGIAFESVTLRYGPGRAALVELSLDVFPGERIALVGPSGSGKSSIVSLLLRLYDPDDGVVKIDGRDVRDYTLASLRGQIAIVLQDSPLFATSIRENIAYGAPGATNAEILHAAHVANAHEFVCALPDGYDTVVGERGSTLSGGQRQRIAIARAALRGASILILDEPTVGLDAESAEAVTEALSRLTRSATTLTVAHDLSTLTDVDRIVVVEGGRVVEEGDRSWLIQRAGRFASLDAAGERARRRAGA